MTSRRQFLKHAGLGAAVWAVSSNAVLKAAEQKSMKKRPNIIVIMSDDVGWTDIGCYGSEIKTPNLDRLAENGLRYSQFYNTARCCPTRASLLTGLHPHQSGVGWMMQDQGAYGYRGDLNDNCVTIAQVLRDAGYSTYMSGKWHVTPAPRSRDCNKHNWPLQRGFDRFYGTIKGAGSFYDPCTLVSGNTLITPDSDDYYYTHAISDHAVQFIDEHPSDAPFFMYVAYTAAHWPQHAPEADIAEYDGVYDDGWEVLRENRIKSAQKLGLMDENWTVSQPDEKVESWDDMDHKAFHSRTMQVYAAQLTIMDRGIGRIVETLEKKGELENTMILYLQDNGACAEQFAIYRRKDDEYPNHLRHVAEVDGPREPMRANELQFELFPAYHRDGQPVKYYSPVDNVGDPYSYIGYHAGWANAGNAPLRMYKHWIHEGGISSPLVVYWPSHIKTKGEWRNQPAQLPDIMATCVQAAGAEYPVRYNGHYVHPMQGLSLMPTFDNQPLNRSGLYWEHEGNRAVRVGDWKAISKAHNNPRYYNSENKIPLSDWELYDLKADRTETRNLAETHPEKLRELVNMWRIWAKQTHVTPK